MNKKLQPRDTVSSTVKKLGEIGLTTPIYTAAEVEARLGALNGTVADFVAEKIATAYKPGGSKTAAQLTNALLIAANEGVVYNLSEDITTTADFVEGAGKKIAAGTNVVVIKEGEAYKFDVLAAPVDGTIVKTVNDITPVNGNVTIPEATATKAGLMSAADKSALDSHIEDEDTHVTTANKAAWNAKYDKPTTGIPATDLAEAVQTSLDKADTAVQPAAITDMAKKSEMSVTAGTGADADKTTIQLKSGTTATVLTAHQSLANYVQKDGDKVLSTNDYTDAEKTKLAGIATGAEVNQNAFSNVKVGDKVVAASAATDTVTLVGGTNITITPDLTLKTITIAGPDTLDISGKADKVKPVTAFDIAILDANGNLVDSEHTLDDYKTKQTAVSSPSASGNDIAFIDTVSQNANGVITATKKNVRAATGTNTGVVTLSDAVNSESDAAAGVAATPKAVKAAKDAADDADGKAAAAQTRIGAIENAAATLLTAVGANNPNMTTTNEIVTAVNALYNAIRAFAVASDNA